MRRCLMLGMVSGMFGGLSLRQPTDCKNAENQCDS